MDELELKKLKRNNMILIVTVILLILVVLGLGYYTYFVRDNETNNLKNNSQETKENDDNINEDTNILTNDEISLVVSNFPYEKLLENKDKTVSTLTSQEKFLIGVAGLSSEDYKKIVITDLCNTSYVNLSKYTETFNADSSAENQAILYSLCVGKKYGFTNTQLLKTDSTLWEEDMIGNSSGEDIFYVINPSVVSDSITLKLGIEYPFVKSYNDNMVFYQKSNLHFTNSILEEDATTFAWIYDKNIDRIFLRPTSYLNFHSQYSVVESGKKEGENYVIKVISGSFQAVIDEGISKLYLSKYATDDDYLSEELSIDINDQQKSDLVLENKEKLNEYNITFKKVGDNYQFVNLDYID